MRPDTRTCRLLFKPDDTLNHETLAQGGSETFNQVRLFRRRIPFVSGTADGVLMVSSPLILFVRGNISTSIFIP